MTKERRVSLAKRDTPNESKGHRVQPVEMHFCYGSEVMHSEQHRVWVCGLFDSLGKYVTKRIPARYCDPERYSECQEKSRLKKSSGQAL